MQLTFSVKNLDQREVGLSPPVMYQNMKKRDNYAFLKFIIIKHNRVMPVDSDSYNLNSGV
jgi:hypothetical protein